MTSCVLLAIYFYVGDVSSAMERSPLINFEKLCDICSSSSRLHEFLVHHNLLFDFNRQCDCCPSGTIQLLHDKSRADGYIWRCNNRNCKTQHSIRKFSFFSGSHLSLQQILKIVYYWSYKYPLEIVAHESGLTPKTLVDFFNFCREVCSVVVEEQSEPIAIGGVGKVVEIDESKFGKRKYNRGKCVEGVWVFGGIERDSNPPKCFFVTVSDRSAATLIPIIKRWILPGSVIASDCWKAYSSLQSEGYIHETVNHSLHFVSETGTHTNNIESRWNALKKSLPKYGTQKQLNNSYFAEYCVRKKFLDSKPDKFVEFLRLIASVYHPPSPGPAPSELLSGRDDGNSVSVSTTTTLTKFDVGNFDLCFSLSSDESDAETSGDVSL